MVIGVYSEEPVILLPAMLLSGLSVIFLLSAVYTVVGVMLLNRTSQQLTWQQMRLPVLIGLNLSMLQIILTSALRLLLTGTWGSIDL